MIQPVILSVRRAVGRHQRGAVVRLRQTGQRPARSDPPVMGAIADRFGTSQSFLIPRLHVAALRLLALIIHHTNGPATATPDGDCGPLLPYVERARRATIWRRTAPTSSAIRGPVRSPPRVTWRQRSGRLLALPLPRVRGRAGSQARFVDDALVQRADMHLLVGLHYDYTLPKGVERHATGNCGILDDDPSALRQVCNRGPTRGCRPRRRSRRISGMRGQTRWRAPE